MNFPILEYAVNTTVISQNENVETLCNTVQFLNRGSSNVVINELNLTLLPGENFTLFGNYNERCISYFNIQFIAAVGEFNELLVIRKKYVNG